MQITGQIVAAGRILDVGVFDHVIITADGHYSMAEKFAGLFTA